MEFKIAFLIIMFAAGVYFFFLGDATGREVAASKDEHPVYTT